MKTTFTLIVLMSTSWFSYSQSQWTLVTNPNADNYFAGGSSGYTNFPQIIYFDGSLFASIYDQGLFRSDDNGTTWIDINNSQSNNNSSKPIGVYKDSLIFMTGNSHVYRSSDKGASWEEAALFKNGTARLFCAGGYCYLLRGNNTVERSSDFGDTWTTLSNGLPSGGSGSWRKYAIIGNTIFISPDNNPGGKHVYKSTDWGDTWTEVTGPNNYSITEMAAAGSRLVVATFGSNVANIYYSDDEGATWTNVGGWNNKLPVLRMLEYQGNLFAVTEATWEPNGLYYSTDMAVSWTADDTTGFNGQFGFKDLAISNDKVFLGTKTVKANRGYVFSKDLGSILMGSGVKDKPANTELKVYPNPMDHTAIISIKNGELEDARLDIFNITGTLIKSVNKLSGSKVEVSKGNLGPGLYFYQISENAEVIGSGKLVVE